ncbi:hypothetical protein PFISCL1PPCAC_28822, partial [Pristionchus fissidentatus]
MTKVKRPDIQGIRGLAIAGVLGFHLKETQFPAGFVGVDIFFVLSGYLMSSILARERSINLQVLWGFYTRRFKRIVPLYALLISILFIMVPLLLFAKDVNKFLSDVIWAAAFATNIHSVVEKTDYFAELYDSNVLTHTWSLGVEIQYYLIVPFVIAVQRLVGDRFSLSYLILLIAGTVNADAFQNVFAALRLVSIALTASVIVLGAVEERQSIMLSNRPIVYLGDLSYVVYLVHWPVVIMWKSYWDLHELPVKDILYCLLITFLISTLIHHTLEQFFIT